jgi:L-alanine-DL-glutamate epimerase-like enolase superfamily enzyme
VAAAAERRGPAIDRIEVEAFTIPTDFPEADGTLSWDSTTIVVVHAHASGVTGLGYTYADVSTAKVIETKLRAVVEGRDAMAPRSAWTAMVRGIRNLGRPGIAAMAVSAVDVARESVPVYGSGGFTAYPDARLQEQLGGWVQAGIPRVKMKVGSEPDRDVHRVTRAREAIGDDAELFVDANGAYSRKQALALVADFQEQAGVVWFEEPVSSDDLEGLRLVRDRAPAGVDIAAGEYGYDAVYFERMVHAGAVDVLQADITRCGGVTELLRAEAICRAHNLPLSLHCGPAIHVHAALALQQLRHLEYFHDHVRIEKLLFDGLPQLRDGALWPDLGCPGMGLELRRADADAYAV